MYTSQVRQIDLAAGDASPIFEGLALTEILGPEAGRYFGEGYRNVTYELCRLPDAGDEATRSEWLGRVCYPAGWSLDGRGRARVQHLATADGIVLAVAAWEREAAACGQAWLADGARVTRVEVVAGRRPWLDLDAVPVTLLAAFGRYRPEVPWEFGCQVGGLEVQVEVAGWNSGGPRGARPDDGVGLAGSVYSQGFAATRMVTRVDKLDADMGLAATTHRAWSEYGGPPLRGVDGPVFPALTAIDHVVTMGQVVQATALAAMRSKRCGMGNLWMRSLSLQMEPLAALLPLEYSSTCQIHKAPARRRASGTLIHDLTAHVETSCGASATASLAYEAKAEGGS